MPLSLDPYYNPNKAKAIAIIANRAGAPQKNLNAWSMRKRGLVFLSKIIMINIAIYLPIRKKGFKSLPKNNTIIKSGIT